MERVWDSGLGLVGVGLWALYSFGNWVSSLGFRV